MKSAEEFKKTISASFWNHIRKESYIPFEETINRSVFCDDLYDKIKERNYHPKLPREYIIANKHNGTTRLIPTFTLEDNCVYYFCVKSLEDYLAKGYIDCTFGGFRLGGVMKEKENDLFNEINSCPFSISPFSYNPKGWVKAWGDFQSRAFQISREGTLQYFIIFDIANFYSTINLHLLENKIRNRADASLSDEIDLLFYFLRYWDRQLSFYSPRSVGIPMDDFGDGSRLLANFFLQEYDKKVSAFCKENGSKYLRYADDQIILTPNKETAEMIFRFASLELNRIGLNINSGKTKHFSARKDFESYWAFEIFEKLQDKNDAKKVGEAISDYLAHGKDKIRWSSVLRKIVGCNLSKVNIALKAKIISEVFNEEFVTGCNHYWLLTLFRILESDTDKELFLLLLEEISNKCLYTEFHYHLLRAMKKGLPINFETAVRSRIKQLKFTI